MYVSPSETKWYSNILALHSASFYEHMELNVSLKKFQNMECFSVLETQSLTKWSFATGSLIFFNQLTTIVKVKLYEAISKFSGP